VEGGSEIKTTLGKEKAKEGKTKKVDFNFSAPHAGSISIAGDFNDWNPRSHPMKKDKKGVWKISLNLAPEHTSIDSMGMEIDRTIQVVQAVVKILWGAKIASPL
jgi:1,4-alpha-glucan branching enzyme